MALKCFLSSVAKDRLGLKLVKVWPTLSSLNDIPANITKKVIMVMKFVWYPLQNSLGALCVLIKVLRNDSSTELT